MTSVLQQIDELATKHCLHFGSSPTAVSLPYSMYLQLCIDMQEEARLYHDSPVTKYVTGANVQMGALKVFWHRAEAVGIFFMEEGGK